MNPVIEEDIDRLTKIFGPEIGALKRKTIRKKYPQVKKDYIELRKELSAENMGHVTLMIDKMSVNGCLFLTTISLDIFYRIAHDVKKKTILQDNERPFKTTLLENTLEET